MLIGQRIRELRESKNLRQGDVEQRTGLLRCYISRVETGRTVPSLATLEKLARALETPLYSIFHDGSDPLEKLALSQGNNRAEVLWGESPQQWPELEQFAAALSRMDKRGRRLLMDLAAVMADQHDRTPE